MQEQIAEGDVVDWGWGGGAKNCSGSGMHVTTGRKWSKRLWFPAKKTYFPTKVLKSKTSLETLEIGSPVTEWGSQLETSKVML